MSVDVTVQSDSRGTGTVTNGSSTYYYSGELQCVMTCPGPDPNGCSITDTFVQTRTIGPNSSTSCIMFNSTDPCCQDDGQFVVATRFVATEYKTSSTDWEYLDLGAPFADVGINQDSGPGNPSSEDNEPANKEHVLLTVDCLAPPTTKEARVRFNNTSAKKAYRVRLRAQVVCPADANQPAVCQCPNGLTGNWDQETSLCQDDPNADPNDQGGNWPGNGEEYPQQFDESYSHIGDPNTTIDDVVCQLDAASGWVWCEQIVLPDKSFEPQQLNPQNSCCDCEKAQKVIVCGELDTLRVRKGNGTWQNVNGSGFDKTLTCSAGDGIEAVEDDHSCFQDMNTFCANPL